MSRALIAALLAVGCDAGDVGTPPEPGPGEPRPIVSAVSLQAARNDDTLFLRARFEAPATGARLSFAVSRRGAGEVRDFSAFGCFVACHDASTEMPNWRPEDGPVTMFLFPGFGGAADVWSWSTALEDPADLSLSTAGRVADAVVDVSASGEREGATWTVLLSRPLSTGDDADVALVPGALYDVAVALHAGASGRDHYVSLPFSLSLGEPEAALEAAVFAGSGPEPPPLAADEIPALELDAVLPGIASYEFLVGAPKDRDGELRAGDYLHGGAAEVATGAHPCADCHVIRSDAPEPPYRSGGALSRLVLRRGGVVGPTLFEEPR